MKLKNAERSTRALKRISKRKKLFQHEQIPSPKDRKTSGNSETNLTYLELRLFENNSGKRSQTCQGTDWESRHCCSWMMLTLFPSEAPASKQFADVSSPAVEPALSRPQRETIAARIGAKRSRRAFFRKPARSQSFFHN